MLRLIRFLITGDGHLHKWRATAQGNFHSRYAIISYGDEGGLEAAKAAAQADYERRILSALEGYDDRAN